MAARGDLAWSRHDPTRHPATALRQDDGLLKTLEQSRATIRHG
jgi:hypothetical protein